MRKFYLQNETGERKGLNGEDGVRLSAPTGLGVSISGSYSALNDEGFFTRTYRQDAQGSIAGELVFTRSAYAKYRELLTWIFAATELTLIYKPEDTEFYRRIYSEVFTKTELAAGHWLHVPFTFRCLTPWYLPVSTRITMEQQLSNALRYPFTYNAELRYGISSAGDYVADIDPSGHIPASILFQYTGAMLNPKITLTGISGTVYGIAAITASFAAGDTLDISTSPRNAYIRKISENTVTDLIAAGAVDLTNDPFPLVPVTEASRLRLTADSVLSDPATVEVNYYFRSV